MMRLAVVPFQLEVPATTLARAAAALQRQVREHFAPTWNLDATVDAFVAWSSVPTGYTRLVLVADVAPGLSGVHRMKDTGESYALVAYTGNWTATLSHECLELLADPSGTTRVPGPSPDPSVFAGTVEYLLEVCDPCQGRSYPIDGIPVSDFCTPDYYAGTPGATYSHAANLTAPGQVLSDGYVLWFADGTWWRTDRFGAFGTRMLGPDDPAATSLRGDGRLEQTDHALDLDTLVIANLYAFSWSRNGEGTWRPGRYFTPDYPLAFQDRLSVVAGVNPLHPTRGFYIGGALELVRGISISAGWHPHELERLRDGYEIGSRVLGGTVPTRADWQWDRWSAGISIDTAILK
jgi:hypothetical protein